MRTTGNVRKWLAPAAALVLGGATGCVVHRVGGGQPRMRDALSLLQDARAQLEQADTDKGGHRVAAIGKVDEAIAEVRAGMEYARGH